MALKHSNPTKPRQTIGRKKGEKPRNFDLWARAPYNFVCLPHQIVPVDEAAIPRQDAYCSGTHTGRILCELTTLTPIYVRSMMNSSDFVQFGDKAFHELPGEDEKSRRAEFFAILSRKLIPGSSLRGMIRSIVEIATYSKVEWVTNEPLVYRAVAESPDGKNATALGENYKRQIEPDGKPAMKAGFIWKRGSDWYIKPALPINSRPFAVTKLQDFPSSAKQWHGYHNAREVAFDETNGKVDKKGDWQLSEDAIGQGQQSGVMFKTGEGVGLKRDVLKNCYVFGLPETSDANDIPISDELIQRYKDQVTDKQREILYGKEDSRRPASANGVLRHKQPVFYLSRVNNQGEEELIFFGHARYLRLPFEHSPLDLVPEHLRKVTEFDFTDAIFGYVGRGNDARKSRAGRVYFSDAVLQATSQEPCLPLEGDEKWLTPQILSSPKPTTFQHYLVQDASQGHEPDCKSDLAHYDTPLEETQIRGHKLYWHKDIGSGSTAYHELSFKGDRGKSKKQLTGVKPVDAGNVFKFTIYFENLTDAELGALLWALTLPGEPNKSYAHKIGMGKPLGMGSVRIKPRLILSHRCPGSEKPSRYEQLLEKDQNDRYMWYTADSSADERINSFVDRFRRVMLTGLNMPTSQFEQLARIKDLLKLLEWPAPWGKSWLRYMQIDRTDEYDGFVVNEYKERPVLPDPHYLNGGSNRQSRPCRGAQQDSTLSSPIVQPQAQSVSQLPENLRKATPVDRSKREPTQKEEAVTQARSIDSVSEGIIVEARVLRVTGDAYECDIGLGEKFFGRLRKANATHPLKEGDIIRVKIVRVPVTGHAELKMKGVSQHNVGQ